MNFPIRTIGEKVTFVFESFQSNGLIPNPSSRWGKIRSMFLDKNVDKEYLPGHPDYEFAIEAMRDLNIMAFVFDVFSSENNELFKEKLRLIVQDASLPQNAKKSFGRDAQAELYLAAICRNAEFNSVVLDEPDVRCEYEGEQIGFAVKRLKNIERLGERIKDASEQIKRTKIPGIIVLETSLMLNPNNDRIWQPFEQEQFMLMHQLALNLVGKHYIEKIHEWVKGAGVLGIVYLDSQMRITQEGSWEHSGMNMAQNTNRYNARRRKHFDKLWSVFETGIPRQLAM